MWFAFGLVTLAVTMAYQWWYRWHRTWQGATELIGGVACETMVRSFRDVVYGMRVALDVPSAYRFELKRESGLDRFFKWTGLAVERQFGHFGFDPLVYVASDDDHLNNRLASSPSLLHAAQHLFATAGNGCRLSRITCEKGRIWMELRAHDWSDEPHTKVRLRDTAELLMPEFQLIADTLDKRAPLSAPEERDRFLIPSIVILCITSGLAINGVVSWMLTELDGGAFVVDTGRLWSLSIAAGATLLAAVVAATLILLGRSARVHLILLEVMLVGAFGALSTSAAELRSANMDWDISTPSVVVRPVVGKSTKESRRRLFLPKTVSYRLEFNDWAAPEKIRFVHVSQALYGKAQVGDEIAFEQRSGYLGIRWAVMQRWAPAEQR